MPPLAVASMPQALKERISFIAHLSAKRKGAACCRKMAQLSSSAMMNITQN
jgi:hypothetical protein